MSDWYTIKDGNIEVFMDEERNIKCVVNHDTKHMFGSYKFQAEIEMLFRKDKDGKIEHDLVEDKRNMWLI